MVLLLVACSGSASRDDEDREEPEEVSAAPPPIDGGSEGSDTTDTADTPPDASGRMDTANGLRRMIRELDRVVEHADARILRTGLGADAASSSQSLDVLGARLRSVRARLAEIRGRE